MLAVPLCSPYTTSMKMSLEDLDRCVVYTLEDNGDWEYLREGIGIYNRRVFIVDLDDTGEEERELRFVKEDLQIHQVLAIGKETGRYGQNPSGSFYYNWDKDGNKECIQSFCEQVGLAVPEWIR